MQLLAGTVTPVNVGFPFLLLRDPQTSVLFSVGVPCSHRYAATGARPSEVPDSHRSRRWATGVEWTTPSSAYRCWPPKSTGVSNPQLYTFTCVVLNKRYHYDLMIIDHILMQCNLHHLCTLIIFRAPNQTTNVLSVSICKYFDSLNAKTAMDFLRNSSLSPFHCMVQIILSILRYGPEESLPPLKQSPLLLYYFPIWHPYLHFQLSYIILCISQPCQCGSPHFLPFSGSFSKMFLASLVSASLITCSSLSDLFSYYMLPDQTF
jgi:hypothetical protein